MTVQKQYFIHAQEKRKYQTSETMLYPQITTVYGVKRACILLGCFENSKQATERALSKGYIEKDEYGGYKFTIKGIIKLIDLDYIYNDYDKVNNVEKIYY